MLDRGKIIIIIGVLYCIGIFGSFAKVIYDQSADKQKSSIENETNTIYKETDPESVTDIKHQETESESEAETTQTETSSEETTQTETSNEETTQAETSSEETTQAETTDTGEETTTEQKTESVSMPFDARVVNTGKSGVNVRESCSLSAKVIGLLKEGEVVEVLEEVDGWYHIRKGKLEGYSFSAYLERIEQP